MNKDINKEVIRRKQLLSNNNVITREYLVGLDKKIDMIPVTFDPMFKSVFGNNLDLLKKFLNDVLGLDLDVDLMEIQIFNNELPKERMKEYQKRIDIYVCINDNFYIDIEINRSNFNRVKLRNYLYSSKLYSMLLKSGKKVSELENKYFCQLNLNTEDKDIDYGEEIIVPYSLTTKSVYIEQDKIILKYLEYYKKLYYTDKKKLDEAGMWLAGLCSTSFVELFDIFSNILDSSKLTNFIGEVIKMNGEYFNIHEWEKEKMDELVKYNYYKDGKKEALDDTVRKMLDNNMDVEIISKVTNKSIDEIRKIEESMKED